jgi:hypothetical protein
MFMAATWKVVPFETCFLVFRQLVPMVPRILLSVSSWYKNKPIMKTDAANTAKTMTPIYLITPRHISVDSNLINSSLKSRL